MKLLHDVARLAHDHHDPACCLRVPAEVRRRPAAYRGIGHCNFTHINLDEER